MPQTSQPNLLHCLLKKHYLNMMWWLVCYEFFFGFEFCCKIWVLLLWVRLGLGKGKIGANLRLETKISKEWSKGEKQEKRDWVRRMSNGGVTELRVLGIKLSFRDLIG